MLEFTMYPHNSAAYQRCHNRVRNKFGKARNYRCRECDDQARDWAWLHGSDPDDPANYVPMCRPCHTTYDYTPERREGQRVAALVAWSGDTTRRAEQATRCSRDEPWTGRWGGGGAR